MSNNYQDNLSRYKYHDTDIFNQKVDYSYKKPSKDPQRSDIFNVNNNQKPQQQQQQQQQQVVKKTNISSIFNNEPIQQQQTPAQQNKKAHVSNSDIFNRSPVKEQAVKKQSQYKPKDNSGETQEPRKQFIKTDIESKRKDNQYLIFQQEDTSYVVKKNKEKDFSKAQQNTDQMHARYDIEHEKYNFMKSDMGVDKSALYDNFTPSKEQKATGKEKAPYNSMWWQNSKNLTKVNEQVEFDRHYAQQKHNQDMASSVFMTEDEQNTLNQQVQQRSAQIQSYNQKQKENTQKDIQNRKKDKHFSDLNGFECASRENPEDHKAKQLGLIPSNMGPLQHDSVKNRINDDQKFEENVEENQYQRQMRSSMDTHTQGIRKTADIQQQKSDQKQHQSDKFQNFQVIEDFEDNNNIDDIPDSQSVINEDIQQQQQKKSKFVVPEQKNKKQTLAERAKEASAYNFNKSKVQTNLTEDPQKLETWEIDPYKDRVSLLQQRKKNEIPVKIIEMELKGLNEKFDQAQFKKICARKGYHLVDFDMQYNFNKATGKGKIQIRNSRKVAEGADSIKQHLKSFGVGVIREKERDATLNNNALQIEPDNQKKKVFSKYDRMDADGEVQETKEQKPKRKPDTARLMSATASSQNHKQQQQKAKKDENTEQIKQTSVVKKQQQQKPVSNSSNVTKQENNNNSNVQEQKIIKKKPQEPQQQQEIQQQQPVVKEQPQQQQVEQVQQQSENQQQSEKKDMNNLLQNSGQPPKIVRKKPQQSQDNEEVL